MPDGFLVWLTINLKNVEYDIQVYLDNKEKRLLRMWEAL